MPKYLYRCERCGGRWLITRPVDQRDLPAVCAECRTPSGRRVFTPTRYLFNKPFTGQWTRGELARAIAPDTPEEQEVWRKYG